MKKWISKSTLIFAALLLILNANANDTITIPEGTEVRIRFNEKLSSETSIEGDVFSIQVEDDVELDGKTVILAGSRGKGEVTSARKKGFVGKAGELNICLTHIKVGDKKVRIRANKSKVGDSKLGTSVALTLILGPLGLLKRGKDIAITEGQTILAFVDDDTVVPFPPPKIPKGN